VAGVPCAARDGSHISFGYQMMKRLLWPGPDFTTRARYSLKRRFLKGPGVTTLDIGCGNGCMTLAAAEAGGSAIGVTIDPDFIARAEAFRDRLGVPADCCRFQKLSIYDLCHANLGTFDQVILFEVLEHLYHDELAISICAALLKPDGWLHVTVPNRDSHRHFGGVDRVETGAHVRHGYDYPTLEALLRRHGLEPLDREGNGGIGTVYGFLAVVAANKLPRPFGPIAGVVTFFLAWPMVKLLDILPAAPLALYVLAAKRTQQPALTSPT
jgi:SAM-dependent methyltransferase